jgi:hypothetical protein
MIPQCGWHRIREQTFFVILGKSVEVASKIVETCEPGQDSGAGVLDLSET